MSKTNEMKAPVDSNREAAGREAGERWAREIAHPDEVLRIWDAPSDFVAHGDVEFHEGWGHVLHSVITGVEGMTFPTVTRAYWRAVLGPTRAADIEDTDFARGFTNGALSVGMKTGVLRTVVA